MANVGRELDEPGLIEVVVVAQLSCKGDRQQGHGVALGQLERIAAGAAEAANAASVTSRSSGDRPGRARSGSLPMDTGPVSYDRPP